MEKQNMLAALAKEKLITRFGHTPTTSAEAKNMIRTLIAEMQTENLVQLITAIKASKKQQTPAFQLGLQIAELEIASR